MQALRSAWAIMNLSMLLIHDHRKLLLFPLISLLGIVAVMWLCLLPALLHGESMATALRTWGESDREIKMALWYFTTIFVLTFLNCAFYHEIIQAYNGERVSLLRGFAAAFQRSGTIALWSLVAGLTGSLFRTLDQYLGTFGRWILSSLGIAWMAASIFVLPVILREQRFRSPGALLGTSARMIHRKWGEGATGLAIFNLLALIAVIGGTVAGFHLLMLLGEALGSRNSGYGSWYVGAGLFLVASVSVMLGAFIMLLKHIFCCGLYIYADEGVIPEKFDTALLDHGWTVKAGH